jgi:metal-responsive CopG/Arc/MetJ family transcriptional regulator
VPKNQSSTTITIVINSKILAVIDQCAQCEDRSRSSMIRKICDEYLTAQNVVDKETGSHE